MCENMSKSLNCFLSNSKSAIETSSLGILPENNFSSFIDTSYSSVFSDYTKTPGTCSEIPSGEFNEIRMTADECAINSIDDSGILECENNAVDNEAYTEFNSSYQSCNKSTVSSVFTYKKNNTDAQNETFQDAFTFFKDTSSIIGSKNLNLSRTAAEPVVHRSSLYEKFDPLYTKISPQNFNKSNRFEEVMKDNTEECILGNLLPSEYQPMQVQSDELEKQIGVDLIQFERNSLNDTFRGCKDSSLISFEDLKAPSGSSETSMCRSSLYEKFDPLYGKCFNQSLNSNLRSRYSELIKVYTEEVVQQLLEREKVELEEILSKRQQDMKDSFLLWKQKLEVAFKRQKSLSSIVCAVTKEAMDLALLLSDKCKLMKENLDMSETENSNLKKDISISREDLQKVENAFSNLHKRYELCKHVLKQCIERERSLVLQVEDMKVQLHEKENMCKAIESGIQDECAIITDENSDAEVEMLKTQLAEAQKKISSIENDYRSAKIENTNLNNRCTELMTTIRKS